MLSPSFHILFFNLNNSSTSQLVDGRMSVEEHIVNVMGSWCSALVLMNTFLLGLSRCRLATLVSVQNTLFMSSCLHYVPLSALVILISFSYLLFRKPDLLSDVLLLLFFNNSHSQVLFLFNCSFSFILLMFVCLELCSAF